jgi:hypothetical protein
MTRSLLAVVVLVGCAGEGGGSGGGPRGGGDGKDGGGGTDTGTLVTTPEQPDADGDGFAADVDCDDSDPGVYPGAPETCDGVRVDCARTSDDGLVTVDGATTYDGLGAALAAATDGSELVVCPGTYVGAFAASVPVRIVALEDATTTILSGSGDSTLQVPGGTELVGLTIRDGNAEEGGGVRMTSAGTLTLTGCSLVDNGADLGGGLWVAEGSTATLVDTTVEGNHAFGGGGIAVSAGSTLDLSQGAEVSGNDADGWGAGVWVDSATLVGGEVHGNRIESYYYPYWYDYGVPDPGDAAWGGAGVAASGVSAVEGAEIYQNLAVYGGGLSVSGGSTELAGVQVHDNQTYQLGGGVAVLGGDLQLDDASEVWGNYGGEAAGGELVVFGSVSGGWVHDNIGQEYGGGVFAVESEVTGQVFSDNVSDNFGGGLFAIGHVAVDGCTFSGNQSDEGGGLATVQDYGTWFYGHTDTVLTVTDTSANLNFARLGGAAYSGWTLDWTGGELRDDTADRGAGLYVEAGSARVEGATITTNSASVSGGAAEVKKGATLSFVQADLGQGASDNAPADVRAGGLDYVFDGVTTATCSDAGC